MSFRRLPGALRSYILINGLLLLPALWLLALHPTGPPARALDPWLLAALLCFTGLFSTWKLELTVGEGRMTPVFAIVCLAMLLQGALGALLSSALGALITSFVRPPKRGWRVELLRPQPHYAFFNLANALLAGAVAALAFQGVRAAAPPDAMGDLLALTAFTLVYFLVNTLGVAGAIAYQQHLRWHAAWHQNFLWTAPGFFASSAAAGSIYAVYPSLSAWSMLFLPPLYLIHYSYRFYVERMTHYAEQVKEDTARIQELNLLNQTLISSLERTVSSRNGRASQNVRIYAASLARAAGLNAVEAERLATVAVAHDMGNLSLPQPPADSAPAQREKDETSAASLLAQIAVAQHERWDGSGFPRRLRGEAIPLPARIVAVVGMFDVLTTPRPYRRAMRQEEAMGILREGAGRQFDPHLVALFEKVLPELSENIALVDNQPGAGSGQLSVVPGQSPPAPPGKTCGDASAA